MSICSILEINIYSCKIVISNIPFLPVVVNRLVLGFVGHGLDSDSNYSLLVLDSNSLVSTTLLILLL